jgi:DNA adenine methylase
MSPRTAAAEAAPIVKWVGGKSKLLHDLVARIPARFRRYYEPFAGGAALFFRLAGGGVAQERDPAAPSYGLGAAVLNDLNADLIATYRQIALDPDAVIRRLEIHRRHHGEKHYYSVRERWNDASVSWTTVDRAATFIYLNKTCYNGLWRVNRSGAFNVPIGRYVDPPICTPDALRAASRALRGAELRQGDYASAVADAGRGDLVYFDPPYVPLSETSSFTSYTGDGFGADDQRALADLARRLVARGCQVMLSNSDTPFVRRIYEGFKVERVWCSRAINSNASRRGEVAEVIILGGC